VRTLTVGELKAQFSQVIDAVQLGESVVVCYGRRREKVAALVPYARFAEGIEKRPLGLLKGKASFSLADDFAVTDEQLLAS
jgi:antitoxin (DNA-binding transcriptional repressor) of toxin-antitoxin stability system